MSTAILPDDSVVVRLPDRTIHVDASRRAVQIRASSARHELGGSLVASHPFARVTRIRIVALDADGGEVALTLELASGQSLALGRAPSRDVAMLTARAVADLCRCKLEAGQGITWVPPSRPELAAADHDPRADALDAPTGPIPAPRWAGSLVGVVPLAEAAEPRRPDDPEPITDERRPPDALHRITRELVRPPRAALEGPLGADGEPVFGALLRESEMAEALDPSDLEAVFRAAGATTGDEGLDQKPTLVGIASLGARPEAVAELLALAAERLPVASKDLALRPGGRTRGRSRAH